MSGELNQYGQSVEARRELSRMFDRFISMRKYSETVDLLGEYNKFNDKYKSANGYYSKEFRSKIPLLKLPRIENLDEKYVESLRSHKEDIISTPENFYIFLETIREFLQIQKEDEENKKREEERKAYEERKAKEKKEKEEKAEKERKEKETQERIEREKKEAEEKKKKLQMGTGAAIGAAGTALLANKLVKHIKKKQDKKKARQRRLTKEYVQLRAEICNNFNITMESCDELFELIDYIYS